VIFLVIAFILVPIAELYVIIKIGGAIGVLPTLALLVADALLGSMLLRHQGRAAWVRFNRALAEDRLPHKEVFDGVLIIFGGALLLTPGFITDVFGLVLLIPPTRALVRRISMRLVRGRMSMGPRAATWTYARAQGRGWTAARGQRRARRSAPGGPRPGDIEGTGQEVRDEDELPPGREPFGDER
jgi:UPF0716 protein FxsA